MPHVSKEAAVAILGWGSLVWGSDAEDKEFAQHHDEWQQGGPPLPIEFSRISQTRDDALTLVIDPECGTGVPTRFCLSNEHDPAKAALHLRRREKTGTESIGVVDLATQKKEGRNASVVAAIWEWAEGRGLRGVVWTDLPSNFKERTGEAYSAEAALRHLRRLDEQGRLTKALEYIENAPPEVETRFRQFLRTDPWFQSRASHVEKQPGPRSRKACFLKRCGATAGARANTHGDPQIRIRIQALEQELKRLRALGKPTEAAVQWLQVAKETFGRWNLILPYSGYDLIWAALYQVRHILCRIAPTEDLLVVVLSIRQSLFYLPDKERRECERTLAAAEQALDDFAHGRSALPEAQVRLDLEKLSRTVGYARDAHWRKVNLLRQRLSVTALSLGILLAVSAGLLPHILTDLSVWSVLTVIVLGAMGGLVSALRTMESVEDQSSAYYIERTRLCLRPFIGSAAGLVTFLMLQAGILSLPGAVGHPKSGVLELAVAYMAGFSERFFFGEIGGVVRSFKSDDGRAK